MGDIKLSEVPTLRVHAWLATGGDATRLVGGSLVHSLRGPAEIKDVTSPDGSSGFLLLFRDGTTRSISISDLRDTRSWRMALITEPLASEMSSQRNDLEAVPEQRSYSDLREKYQIVLPGYEMLPASRSRGVWKFFELLQKVDCEDHWIPRQDTFAWLEERQVSGLLAVLYERRFRSYRDAWDAARASKKWRLLKHPGLAIRASADIADNPDRFEPAAAAAALVSRAAAFADLGRHSESDRTLRLAETLGEHQEYLANVRARLDHF